MGLDHQLIYELWTRAGPDNPKSPNYRASWVDGAISRVRQFLKAHPETPIASLRLVLDPTETRPEHQVFLAVVAAKMLEEDEQKWLGS